MTITTWLHIIPAPAPEAPGVNHSDFIRGGAGEAPEPTQHKLPYDFYKKTNPLTSIVVTPAMTDSYQRLNHFQEISRSDLIGQRKRCITT